jgi:hypothetical protein
LLAQLLLAHLLKKNDTACNHTGPASSWKKSTEQAAALLACLLPCSYVRLQLLQGVVAHHMGDRLAALRHLQAAQRMWQSLQVSHLAHTATTAHLSG